MTLINYQFVPRGSEIVEEWAKFRHDVVWTIMHYGPRFIIAIFMFYFGRVAIKLLLKGITSLMLLRDYDATLIPFVRSVLKVALQLFLIISILTVIGVNTASFITVLGAAGLAVGLALQGSLSNFAGGVLILFFKPFRVGDFILAQGYKGTVKEIQILYTILTTPDNKKVVIPNGNLSNKEIINYSAEDLRRLELKFTIGYKSDLDKVSTLVKGIISENADIHTDPAPTVGVAELTNEGISLDIWFWVQRSDVMKVQYEINANIVKKFNDNEISFGGDTQEIIVHQDRNG